MPHFVTPLFSRSPCEGRRPVVVVVLGQEAARIAMRVVNVPLRDRPSRTDTDWG